MSRPTHANRVSVAADMSKALIGMCESSNSYIYTMAWRAQAQECLSAMLHVYSFLRSRSDIYLTPDFIRDVLWQLAVLEAMAWDEDELWDKYRRPAGYFSRTYSNKWAEVIRPLQHFVLSLPLYCSSRRGRQWPDTSDGYMFVVRQMANLCCDLRADLHRSVPVLQPLPEAKMADRILTLDTGVGYDVASDRREAVSCK